MQQVVTGAILVLALAIAAPVSAQVINACAKDKSGALRVVADPSECTSHETPIAWNAAGPPGPQGPLGDRGPSGDNLVVIDGFGNTVGQLVSMSYRGGDPYLVIFLESVNAVVGVGLRFGRLQDIAGPSLWFGDAACGGPAYVAEKHAGYLLQVIPTNETVRRYFVARMGPLTGLVIAARAHTDGVCGGTSGGGAYLEAEDVTDLLDLTFPLEVPLTVDRQPG